jgi:hypothetical protein
MSVNGRKVNRSAAPFGYNTKLDEERFKLIEQLYKRGVVIREIARRMGASPACIGHFLSGRTYGGIGKQPSRRRGACKLTDDLVLKFRRMAKGGMSLGQIARSHPDVDRLTIRHCVRGHTWSHLPGAIPGYRQPPLCGSAHPRAKLSDHQIREIRDATGLTLRTLAEKFGVGVPMICRIRKGERRVHLDNGEVIR